MSDDLLRASACDLARAIRTRATSSTEVLDSLLTAVAERNPGLNAIVTLDADRARSRAHEADEALARGHCWGRTRVGGRQGCV